MPGLKKNTSKLIVFIFHFLPKKWKWKKGTGHCSLFHIVDILCTPLVHPLQTELTIVSEQSHETGNMVVNDFSHLGMKGRLSLKITPKKLQFFSNTSSSSLSFNDKLLEATMNSHILTYQIHIDETYLYVIFSWATINVFFFFFTTSILVQPVNSVQRKGLSRLCVYCWLFFSLEMT